MTGQLHDHRDEQGIIGLLGVIVFGSVTLVIGLSLIGSTLVGYQNANKRIASTQSFFNAEGGAEDVLMRISRDGEYGDSTETVETVIDGESRAVTTTKPDSEPGCSGAKEITSEGYVIDLVRRVRLTNCETTEGGGGSGNFPYAVQAGTEGIYMKNNSRITGNVFSNGSVTGDNNPNINGDVTIANTVTSELGAEFDPNGVNDFTFGNVSGRTDIAQSFVADTSAGSKLDKVELKLRKIGNPQNATVRLVSNSGNSPGSSTIASGTLYAQSTSSSFDWETVGFPALPTLSNGTKYWIVIDVPHTNGGNYWAWAADGSLAGQTLKHASSWSSGNWADGLTDGAFRTYLTNDTPTEMEGINNNGSTRAHFISNSSVQGDAWFTGVDDTNINGTVTPGANDEGEKPMPISDAQIQAFRDEAEAGGTINNDVVIKNNAQQSIGPKKIDGDLEVTNNGKLIITGTIWVTGDIEFKNNTQVVLSSSFGPKSGVVLADGEVSIQNNINISGINNNAIFLISMDDSDDAMLVQNNAAGVVFYAPNGRLWLKNNAAGVAAAANRILLENNASLTYANYLGDVEFTAGGVAGRLTKGWREVVCDSTEGQCQPVTE